MEERNFIECYKLYKKDSMAEEYIFDLLTISESIKLIKQNCEISLSDRKIKNIFKRAVFYGAVRSYRRVVGTKNYYSKRDLLVLEILFKEYKDLNEAANQMVKDHCKKVCFAGSRHVVLSYSTMYLDLPNSIKYILVRHDITELRDFMSNDIKSIKGIGRKRMKMIKDALAIYDIHLMPE